MKSSRPSLCESRDKRPLDRDPDIDCDPKKLYSSVGVTPAPDWVPTQRPLVPSFTWVVG